MGPEPIVGLCFVGCWKGLRVAWVALSLESRAVYFNQTLGFKGAAQCELKPWETFHHFHSSVLSLCDPIKPAPCLGCASQDRSSLRAETNNPHI